MIKKTIRAYDEQSWRGDHLKYPSRQGQNQESFGVLKRGTSWIRQCSNRVRGRNFPENSFVEDPSVSSNGIISLNLMVFKSWKFGFRAIARNRGETAASLMMSFISVKRQIPLLGGEYLDQAISNRRRDRSIINGYILSRIWETRRSQRAAKASSGVRTSVNSCVYPNNSVIQRLKLGVIIKAGVEVTFWKPISVSLSMSAWYQMPFMKPSNSNRMFQMSRWIKQTTLKRRLVKRPRGWKISQILAFPVG